MKPRFLLVVLLAIPLALTGCANLDDAKGTSVGIALAKYGYVPVEAGPMSGTTFVVCGNVRDPAACYERRTGLATDDHPVIETNYDGVVTRLIGTRPKGSNRNYTLVVPREWQDFANLQPADQKILLNIMPEAITAYDESELSTDSRSVPTPIGQSDVSLELIS